MYINPFSIPTKKEIEVLSKAAVQNDLFKLRQKAITELDIFKKLYESAVIAQDWELKDRLVLQINKRLDILEIK